MLVELRRFSCCEDVFSLGNFSLSSVRYEQILVHLYGGFVSQDAIFWYANAVKGGAKSAHATHDKRTLQRGNDGRRHGPGDQERTDARHPEKSCAKQQAPQPAPQNTHLSPILHPVSAVVVAYNVFLSVIIFADDRQLLRVKAALLEFPHSCFGFGVGVINRDHRFGVGYGLLTQCWFHSCRFFVFFVAL